MIRSTIKVDGNEYVVVENCGFNHDVGAYVKIVKTPAGELRAVRVGNDWRFWSAADRTAPLVQYAEREARLKRERISGL